MSAAWQQFLTQWHLPLEILAVVFAVLYLLLAMREHVACWLFAALSTLIYIALYHRVALLSESLLNVYYLAMALYGWWRWRGGHSGLEPPIQSWPWRKHMPWVLLCAACVPALAWWTARHGAAFPLLDAFTSVFAVLATWLVARKVLENWYYWLLIDSINIFLNWHRGLQLTAGLYVAYVVLVVLGLLQWRARLAAHNAEQGEGGA